MVLYKMIVCASFDVPLLSIFDQLLTGNTFLNILSHLTLEYTYTTTQMYINCKMIEGNLSRK